MGSDQLAISPLFFRFNAKYDVAIGTLKDSRMIKNYH